MGMGAGVPEERLIDFGEVVGEVALEGEDVAQLSTHVEKVNLPLICQLLGGRYGEVSQLLGGRYGEISQLLGGREARERGARERERERQRERSSERET